VGLRAVWGLGNAFFEELVYDENGQLLNASFMDFLLPTALDVPRVEVGHEETVLHVLVRDVRA